MLPVLTVTIISLLSALFQGTHPATAPVHTGPRQGLRVLTWNIQGCAGGVDSVVDELRQHDADLICLQEAEVGTERTGGASQAALVAKRLNLHHFSAGSAFAKGGEQHMAILSREPLEKPEPLDADTGRIYGVTAITRVHGKPVRIISVHLTNNYWRGLKQALIADNAPAREATDLARQLRDWKEPVVLAGDFNAIPGMREHNLIAGQLARVPTTQPTYPSDKPKLAVDHIYHSAAFRAAKSRTPPSKASDHRPLIVDLQPRPAEFRPNPE